MNTIVLRIADFLKEIPPFSFLSKQEQVSVASSIKIEYYDTGETVFEIDQVVNDVFYLVKEGAVGLYSEDEKLSDECDEGDIFGLRALIRKGHYKLSAKAAEESIVYTIPSEIYQRLISKNVNAASFIIQSFASNLIKVKEEGIEKVKTYETLIEEELTAKYSKNPITCSEETTIEIAAQIMTVKRVGSIIIEYDRKPIGIITDKDLRTKIATGKFSIKEKVTKIMSSPVICYPDNITIAEAQIAMLKNKITHLCITKNGKDSSDIVGLLSEHDIILIRENNPSVLIKEIKRAFYIEELVAIRKKTENLLVRYLNQNVSIAFIAKIVSEINNALTSRAIALAIEGLNEEPPVPFSWVALGSQGRKEQILLTDQDNAIVFEDSNNNKTNRTYFLSLANIVTQMLHQIGFEYCPAEMMASNKQWCLSVSEWKEQYQKWISSPTQENVMFCTIFFDFQTIHGHKNLGKELMTAIYKYIKKGPLFLKYLGVNALQNPPPLGFFRQFLVEESGEHKDQFDIKSKAMMPLVDAARILSLEKEIDAKNTLDRYSELIQLEPQNKVVYEDCIEAYKTLLLFRIFPRFPSWKNYP